MPRWNLRGISLIAESARFWNVRFQAQSQHLHQFRLVKSHLIHTEFDGIHQCRFTCYLCVFTLRHSHKYKNRNNSDCFSFKKLAESFFLIKFADENKTTTGMKLPIGIQDFESLRIDGYAYVD